MRSIYITLGCLCLALGAVGAVLPLLPTVPFLLLASYCFAKGSPRFYNWFTQTKLYQQHLQEFETSRSMALKTKILILSVSTAMMSFPLWLTNNRLVHLIVAVLLVIKYYYFIYKIKTVK